MYFNTTNFLNRFFFENIFLNILVILSFCCILFFPISFLNREIDKNEVIVEREQKVLKKLLNMIEGF